MKTISICVVSVLGLVAGLAHGYRVGEHEVITRRAVSHYNQCFPKQVYSPRETDAIVAGNLSEDFNLARKWLKNSHYYNPRKWIRTLYRDDAGYRVRYLEKKMVKERTLRTLGKIVHFVQDMSSPPHVVPVVHNLGDGFEKFELRHIEILDLQLPCSAVISPPFALLKSEALQTLDAITHRALALKDGQEFPFTWQLFWYEGLGSKFGFYGFFGNNFGETRQIEIMNHVYLFSADLFHEFKLQRVQQSISATMQSLHWYRQRAQR